MRPTLASAGETVQRLCRVRLATVAECTVRLPIRQCSCHASRYRVFRRFHVDRGACLILGTVVDSQVKASSDSTTHPGTIVKDRLKTFLPSTRRSRDSSPSKRASGSGKPIINAKQLTPSEI